MKRLPDPRKPDLDPTGRVPVHQLGTIEIAGTPDLQLRLIDMGDWVVNNPDGSTRTYVPGNVVTDTGVHAQYVCIATVAGGLSPSANAAHWQLFISDELYLTAQRVFKPNHLHTGFPTYVELPVTQRTVQGAGRTIDNTWPTNFYIESISTGDFGFWNIPILSDMDPIADFGLPYTWYLTAIGVGGDAGVEIDLAGPFGPGPVSSLQPFVAGGDWVTNCAFTVPSAAIFDDTLSLGGIPITVGDGDLQLEGTYQQKLTAFSGGGFGDGGSGYYWVRLRVISGVLRLGAVGLYRGLG